MTYGPQSPEDKAYFERYHRNRALAVISVMAVVVLILALIWS